MVIITSLSAQSLLNKKIKQNRINMRKSVKLSLNLDENFLKYDRLPLISHINPEKPHNRLKLDASNRLNTKQFILGNFQHSYDLKQKIGEGAHATIFRCIQKASLKQYAVKITKQGDQQLLYSTKEKFFILKKLNHQNIIKAESFYIDKIKMTTYLICQLCPFEQLTIFLKNRNSKIICLPQAINIIIKLIQTLQYLHKAGVCHRDIKPQNILYDPVTQKMKIIDFDCSKMKRPNDQKFQMWTKTGSLNYQAPQYFKQTYYNEKVDIWAAGVIAYQLITGFLPYNSNYYKTMVEMIMHKDINFENIGISIDYKVLLKRMLMKNPKLRISAEQCSRLPGLLKTDPQHLVTGTTDDFLVLLENHTFASYHNFHNVTKLIDSYIHRKRQTSHSNKDHSKSLIKYFCFVGDI